MENAGYRIEDQYAVHFLTFTVVGWVDIFTRKECRHILIESFKYCQAHKGLLLHAYIIMSNHVHLLASAKPDSPGLSAIIRDFKKFTSKAIIKWMKGNRKESRRQWLEFVFKYFGKYNSNNEVFQVWMQHNRPMICITPKYTQQKINYIHRNPVKAETVTLPEDYIYSSARNYAGRSDYVLWVDVIKF